MVRTREWIGNFFKQATGRNAVDSCRSATRDEGLRHAFLLRAADSGEGRGLRFAQHQARGFAAGHGLAQPRPPRPCSACIAGWPPIRWVAAADGRSHVLGGGGHRGKEDVGDRARHFGAKRRHVCQACGRVEPRPQLAHDCTRGKQSTCMYVFSACAY